MPMRPYAGVYPHVVVESGLPVKVLVVDDDPDAQKVMSKVVKKAGWESIEAANGREALEKIAVGIPSVILLDLMMPEMDGFSVLEALQQNKEWRQIPVIIVTAKELTADERSLLQKRTVTILQKGAYSRKDLISAIRDHVDHIVKK